MPLGLETLIDDVLIHVLSILSVWDLLRVRQTSKRMESLSHVRNVWHTIFKREVVATGRPIPGYSFSLTPRLLTLLELAVNDLSTLFATPLSYECVNLIESSDLEARTLHALRLEKRWKSSISELKNEGTRETTHPSSRSFSFQTLEAVHEVFLLPGGRYVVTVHRDRLRCWDLGFPRPFQQDQDQEKLSLVRNGQVSRCVGEWILPSGMGLCTSLMDASEPDSSVYFAVCPDIEPSWTEPQNTTSRTCAVLSVRCDRLRAPSVLPFDGHGTPLGSPVPAFLCEGTVTLPDVLPTPVYQTQPDEPAAPEEFGPHRFANGKLGKLLHIHDNLIFFASFIPPAAAGPNAEGAAPARYAGIEVIDWTGLTGASTKSVLLEYPDPQLGAYVGLYVHESAEHILVVWTNCIGLYPIPRFSPCARSGMLRYCAAPERIVLMPIIIFALSEVIEQPIAFSTCHAAASALDALGSPRPLTILARSRRHPNFTVQSVLTDSTPYGPNPNATPSSRKFSFRLSRVPAPTPPYFVQPTAGQDRDGVCALALGSSGRGVRADVDGAIYRCAPSDIVLPTSNGGTVATVDFWPYRRVDSLPEPLAQGQGQADERLVVRFDDGMGRMVVARVPVPEGEGASVENVNRVRTVTVLDFA